MFGFSWAVLERRTLPPPLYLFYHFEYLLAKERFYLGLCTDEVVGS